MQFIVWCNLVLLFLTRRASCSRLQLEKLSENENRRSLECLESLIDVTDWAVDHFLVIFDATTVADADFFKRYPNFSWKIHSGVNSVGFNNLTGLFNVIFFVRNFDTLNETLSEISIRRMNSRAKFVISVTDNFSSLDEIRKASEGNPASMWNSDKTRVVYLVPCKDDILAMTYFPFARNCQVSELEVLDIWRGRNFEKGTELFPETMLDIRGCVQNYSANFVHLLEFQLRKEFTETGDMILGGVGGKLITIVAEKMNMELYLLPEGPGYTDWLVLLDQVIDGESLFSISGNIPTADRAEIFDGIGYMEESLAFSYVIGDLEVSWKSLVWPLSTEAWKYVGFICLLFCGLIFLINRCFRRAIVPDKLIILDSFGIFLGVSQVLPRSYFGRYLFGMWIIYSYLINVSYNSSLVSFLTTPKENRVINTLEDLLAEGIVFGGIKIDREYYNDPSDPVMMEIYDKYIIWSQTISTDLLSERQVAVGAFESVVRMHNSDHSGEVNRQLRMLKQKAFSFQSPIFLRRGSPFTFGVQRYTSQVIQSGLFEYWLRHYSLNPSTARIVDKGPTRISIEHVRGVLYLNMFGLILSSVVFVLEMICHKYFLNDSLHQFVHEIPVSRS